MDFAIVFACSGFLAGLIAQKPSRSLSKRLGSRELGESARQEVRSLLFNLSDADFLHRYLRTLSLLVRWIGMRCTLLTIHLAVMIVCYMCIVCMVNWMNDAAGGLHFSDWTFSLCAMFGASLKSLVAGS